MPAGGRDQPNPRKRFRRLQENDTASSGKQADVRAMIEPAELLELLAACIDAGIALTIGRTRDGGALSVVFLVDGDKIKRYPPTREAWLALLAEASD